MGTISTRLNTYKKARLLIQRHEGLRLRPYTDTTGNLTIGWGHNLDALGISKDAALYILEEDMVEAISTLKRVIGADYYRELDEIRLVVLIDMAFNLGPRLQGFKNMLSAIRNRDYVLATAEMLDSKWADQVGVRAERLAQMMRTGEWPE